MRYNYIELIVEQDEEVDVRYDTYDFYLEEEVWYAAGDILFCLDVNQVDIIGNIYVKIPETHPLFNWSVLDKTRWVHASKQTPFQREQYNKLGLYAVEQLEQAGVPVTIQAAKSY